MCIPCDWLLLGDVTNSLLKRNKPSILLSTCRVVYTLLVSSSCGSLYQCDFKTYNLVCHVHACCHTQTDKQTHWHTERQNPFHVSALWTATTLSLSSVIAVNLVMLMIFPFSSDCHSKLPQPRHQAGGGWSVVTLPWSKQTPQVCLYNTWVSLLNLSWLCFLLTVVLVC